MGGMYFSDKLLFSEGNALIPVEIAARDRQRRQPPRRKTRNTRSKKKKTNMSKNKRSVVIKASKSRGVINAININIGDKEKKSEDIAPRNFSQSFAPTIYQAPQVRDGDGRGGFVLDENMGDRTRRRERERDNEEYREDKKDYFRRNRPDKEETPKRGGSKQTRTVVAGKIRKSGGLRFFGAKKGPPTPKRRRVAPVVTYKNFAKEREDFDNENRKQVLYQRQMRRIQQDFNREQEEQTRVVQNIRREEEAAIIFQKHVRRRQEQLKQNMRRMQDFNTVDISPQMKLRKSGPASSELDLAKGEYKIDKSRIAHRQPPKPTTPKTPNVSLVGTPASTTRSRVTPSPFVQANSPESRAIERRARVRKSMLEERIILERRREFLRGK